MTPALSADPEDLEATAKRKPMGIKHNVWKVRGEGGTELPPIVASLHADAIVISQGDETMAQFAAPNSVTPWTESPEFTVGNGHAVFGALYVPKWTHHDPYIDGELFQNGRSLNLTRRTLEQARASAQTRPFSSVAFARLLVVWLPYFLPLAAARGLTRGLTAAGIPALLLLLVVLYAAMFVFSYAGRLALTRIARENRSVTSRSWLVALAVLGASLAAVVVGILIAAPSLGY